MGNTDCIQFPAICSPQTGYLYEIVNHIREEGIVPIPKDADIHWYLSGKVTGDTASYMIGLAPLGAGVVVVVAGIGEVAGAPGFILRKLKLISSFLQKYFQRRQFLISLSLILVEGTLHHCLFRLQARLLLQQA